MHDPVPPGQQARIRQAFLLGLSRHPLAPPPSLGGALPAAADPMLAVLALTGQRRRFGAAAAAAAAPVPDAARALHGDPRPILPPPARRALGRLAVSVEKSLAATVMPAALRRVAAAGLRPHPFDLPALARHIRADPDNHGRAERAYLALADAGTRANEEQAAGLLAEAVTAANWTAFPPAQRRLFVAAVRRRDPAEGRALVEAVWKTEPAAVRAALLEALAAGLGADDKAFLDGLAGDRAETVRTIAARLARLAAAGSLAQRLAAAARCFTRTGGAIAALGIGGAGRLMFAPPAGTGAAAAEPEAEAERLFTGLPLGALARAVGAAPDEIVAAVPDHEHRVRALLLQAAAADGAAALQGIASARLLAAATMPAAVIGLAGEARVAVDPAAAAQFLAGPVWQRVLAVIGSGDGVARDDGSLVCTAALMPAAAMPAFVAAIAGAAVTATRAARDFADLVLALPADATHEAGDAARPPIEPPEPSR